MVDHLALTQDAPVQIGYRLFYPRRLMDRPLGYEPNSKRSSRFGDVQNADVAQRGAHLFRKQGVASSSLVISLYADVFQW